MERKRINRLKVVLAEKGMTNKQLSEILDKDPAIRCVHPVLRYCQLHTSPVEKARHQHIDKATDGSKNPTATGSMGLKNYEI